MSGLGWVWDMGLLCSPVSERPWKPVRHDGNKDLKIIPGLNLQRRETEGLGHTLTSLLLLPQEEYLHLPTYIGILLPNYMGDTPLKGAQSRL